MSELLSQDEIDSLVAQLFAEMGGGTPTEEAPVEEPVEESKEEPAEEPKEKKKKGKKKK